MSKSGLNPVSIPPATPVTPPVTLTNPPQTLQGTKLTKVPFCLGPLSQSTASLTDSQLWLMPLPVFAPCTLAELHGRTDSTAGSAGSVARMGVYSFAAGASPLFDSGPIATTSINTTFIATANLALAVGWYLVAFVAQGNPVTKPSTRVGFPNGASAILGYDTEAYFSNDAGVWAYTMSGVSGALPQLSALTSVNAAGASAPIVGLKFA